MSETRADVRISVFDTEPATWNALAQVFEVKTGGSPDGMTTWLVVTDRATGVSVTFFKSHDSDAEWSEDDEHGAGCATRGSSAAECTCGKADALAEAAA